MKIIAQRMSHMLPDAHVMRAAVRCHKPAVLLAVALLLGVACGALLSRQAAPQVLTQLDFLFNSNYALRSTMSQGAVFAASVASSAIFILGCLLCGLSVWGAFLLPALPFLRGLGLGMTAGFLYVSGAWSGVAFYAVVLLPGAFVSCIAIILAAQESLFFSRRLSNASLSGKSDPPQFSSYFLRLGRSLLLTSLAALLDMLLAWAFAGKITW